MQIQIELSALGKIPNLPVQNTKKNRFITPFSYITDMQDIIPMYSNQHRKELRIPRETPKMLTSQRKQRIRLYIYIIFLVILGVGLLSSYPVSEVMIKTPTVYTHEQVNSDYFFSSSTVCPSSSKACKLAQMMQIGSVGEQRYFWIQNFTDFTHYQVHATLLAIADYSAVFTTNTCINIVGESSAIEYAENICEEFDSVIFPRITNLAGHPNGTLGDIDGDPHIVILLSSNLVSYYSQYNELPTSPSNPYSNECEMIYIYYWTWLLPTIAHEFHHLIWFNTEMDEQQFTLEGLATYAEYHAGYLDPYENLEPRVPDFLAHSEDSLLYWNGFEEDGLSSRIDYGGAYMFTFYIAEKYGVDILRDLLSEPTDGPEGIEATLQAAGHELTFNDLYLDWMTAITLDELDFNNNLYGYENLDARINHHTLITLPNLPQLLTLQYYGTHAYKITIPSDRFFTQIHKAANTTIGLSVAFHDTHGWHVQQHIIPDGQTSFTETINGSGIDETYIIASYLSNSTPPGHREYGLGPSTTIQLTLTATDPQIPSPDPPQLMIGIIVIIVAIPITAVLILRRRRRIKPS